LADPKLHALLLAASLALAPAALRAETPAEPAAAQRARDARQSELDAVTRDIAVSEERRKELRAEIDAIDQDSASLNQALIDKGRSAQDLEARMAATETRFSALARDETAVHQSLVARRDVLAEVLAALQRMGHRPPPAILVRPEDALASVRSAILLGAVVPDLRAAASKLADDLRSLVALRKEIETERDNLRRDAVSLAEDRARIEILLEEKRKRRATSVEALAGEEQRAADLARQATGLKDLISRMESEIEVAAKAAAEAEVAARTAREKPAGKAPPTSLGDADRLAPAVAFADTRGLLPLPVSGKQVRGFGDDDGFGAKAQGISVSTRAGAQVVSPADGWVVYAGPFRSYGQLLILNAGGGYHVLLAGMERIDVQLGQFVLAGEPVAVMAMSKLASAGDVAIGSTEPVLYIEFRKDGNSIDPAPWWAIQRDEKVGG
jgi:septal ring factor EnvC (AmiA/AmiB activator)